MTSRLPLGTRKGGASRLRQAKPPPPPPKSAPKVPMGDAILGGAPRQEAKGEQHLHLQVSSGGVRRWRVCGSLFISFFFFFGMEKSNQTPPPDLTEETPAGVILYLSRGE